ncbi:hypothetical protein F511_40158 [Dorcoceras hygrometricum]|uniref:CCHC-type domain-containing protein n=1 Tax=Dorcoceras hygrometricum TaxID=472368 RepID=A0A2Z7CKX6_9LAMI|nr:hypothetical protein F511_40158 [Dorcoceras hygrometricum]
MIPNTNISGMAANHVREMGAAHALNHTKYQHQLGLKGHVACERIGSYPSAHSYASCQQGLAQGKQQPIRDANNSTGTTKYTLLNITAHAHLYTSPFQSCNYKLTSVPSLLSYNYQNRGSEQSVLKPDKPNNNNQLRNVMYRNSNWELQAQPALSYPSSTTDSSKRSASYNYQNRGSEQSDLKPDKPNNNNQLRNVMYRNSNWELQAQPALSYPSSTTDSSKRSARFGKDLSVQICSSHVDGSRGGVTCGQCRGRHMTSQCRGVRGLCHQCVQPGHFSRVCPLMGGQAVSQLQQGSAGGSSQTPQPFAQSQRSGFQPREPSRFGGSATSFSVSEREPLCNAILINCRRFTPPFGARLVALSSSSLGLSIDTNLETWIDILREREVVAESDIFAIVDQWFFRSLAALDLGFWRSSCCVLPRAGEAGGLSRVLELS